MVAGGWFLSHSLAPRKRGRRAGAPRSPTPARRSLSLFAKNLARALAAQPPWRSLQRGAARGCIGPMTIRSARSGHAGRVKERPLLVVKDLEKRVNSFLFFQKRVGPACLALLPEAAAAAADEINRSGACLRPPRQIRISRPCDQRTSERALSQPKTFRRPSDRGRPRATTHPSGERLTRQTSGPRRRAPQEERPPGLAHARGRAIVERARASALTDDPSNGRLRTSRQGPPRPFARARRST